MSTCQYFHNGTLLATGMPEIKQWLFDGGLERLLPNEMVGQVDGGVRFTQKSGSTVTQVKSWLPKQVTALMNAGKLKVVQSIADLPEFLRDSVWLFFSKINPEIEALVSEANNILEKYNKKTNINDLTHRTGLYFLGGYFIDASGMIWGGGSQYELRSEFKREDINRLLELRAKAIAIIDKEAKRIAKENFKKLSKSLSYLYDVWGSISDNESAFYYGNSESSDIETIANDMTNGVVSVESESDDRITLSTKNGSITIRKTDTDTPYIQAISAGSNKGKQGGGTALYQVALTWAHNNNKVMRGDPDGLTDVNVLRRTENMISSALRHGTTKHLKPHAVQKEEGLQWKGTDEQKIALMLSFSKDLVFDAVPSLKDIAFVPQTGKFELNGKEISDEDIEDKIAESSEARKIGVGLSTAKRAIITSSALQELQDGKLEKLLPNEFGRLITNPILYSANLAGVEALYDPKTDTIYLVADMLTKESTPYILAHELTHRAESTDKGIQNALNRLKSSIQTAFDNAAKGIGSANDLAAYQRVIEAQTAKKDQLSEFIAYKVTEFLSNPANTENTVANAIKRWISAIKVFLVRNGLDMGFIRSLDESDFVAMSRYGARVNELQGNTQNDVVALASKSGYEGNDKGEAFEWLRAVAKGLDMSEEARMSRAKAMGYDTDTIYYNGSYEPVTEIRKKTDFENNFDGLFLSKNDDVASNFGSGIINQFIARDEFVIDNLENDDTPYSEIINYLQGRYKNATEEQLEDVIYPAIVEDKNVFRMDEDEVLSVTGSDDLGEVSWEFQNERGLLAKHLGYDIVSMDDENGTSYFAPYGSKIRSINAAFDPDYADSPNLLASTTDDIRFSRAFEGESTETEESILPKETKFDTLIRHYQNYLNPWRQAQNQVGNITKDTDVIAAAERYPNITGTKIQAHTRDVVNPLWQRMAKAKITANELAALLYARAAPAKNAEIAKINPAYPDNGSGMTNAEAQQIIDDTKAEHPNFAEIESLAKDFQKITRETLAIQVASGETTAAEAAKLQAAQPDYIPLRDFQRVDDSGAVTRNKGMGLSTGRRLSAKELGRDSKAGQIIENILQDYSRAVMWQGKTEVIKVVENFINANPEFGTVNEPPTSKMQDKSGKVREVITQFNPEKEVRYIKDGKEVRIQIKAPLLVQSINKLNETPLRGLYAVAGQINSGLREMWTVKNPAFFLINPVRDIQTAVIVLTSKGGVKLAKDMVKNWAGSWKEAWNYSNGKPSSAIMQSWLDNGGSINTAYLSSMEQATRELHNQLNRFGGESVSSLVASGEYKQAMKTAGFNVLNNRLFDVIESLNSAFESATRLATFKAAKASGYSNEDAARLAVNVTVNFSRKGEYSKQLGAMYLFSNASIQSIENVYNSLTTGKHKGEAWAMLGGLVALGFMAALSSGDDGEDDLISDYEKERNIIIDLGGGNRLDIPMPYNFSFFHDIGRAMGMAANGGDTGKISMKLAEAFFSNFSPIGNPIQNGELDSKNSIVQFAPTFAKPAIMPAVNRGAFGSELMPDSPFKKNQPDSEKVYRKSRGSIYDLTAKELNSLTGGDKAQSGWIDVSPETLKNTINYIWGGAGRFLGDVGSLAAGSSSDIPILKSFSKETSIDDYRRRGYGQFDEVTKAAEKLAAYKKPYDKDAIEKLKEESGGLLKLSKSAKMAKNIIKQLRDREDEVRRGDNDPDKLARLEEREKDLLTRFNDKFSAAMKV